MQFKDFKKGQKIIPADKTKGLLLVKKVTSKEVVLENLALKKSATFPKEVVDGGRFTGFEIQVAKGIKAKLNPKVKIAEKKESTLNPIHYHQGTIEPWDFIASQNLNFLAGNVVKYVSRYKHKNGVEDLKKAKTYLQKLIAIEEQSK